MIFRKKFRKSKGGRMVDIINGSERSISRVHGSHEAFTRFGFGVGKGK